MAEVRGKIIKLTGSLMILNPEAQKIANDQLFKAYGKHWAELGENDWINSKYWDIFMNTYAEASPLKEKALISLGQMIYPFIKQQGQIPANVDTPLKLLQFEGEGFKIYHRGPDVKPRTFLKLEEGNVIIDATSPGYNCTVIEGVFLGILKMFNKTGKVIQTKCVKKGDNTCEYHITW